MKTILAVDSTSEILSVSLSNGLNILSEIKDDKSMKHMVNIISDIDFVLRKADKTIKEIELFAVNLGPGDFTGGRIGISVVKMFSMLSGNPVLGFNSLDVFSVGCMLKNIGSISKKISYSGQLYIMPVMDVRNGEIYSSIYEVSKSGNDNKVIFSFNFEDKKYFLKKMVDGFLVKSNDFSKKISQIINQDNLLDKCSFSPQVQISKDSNSHKDQLSKKNINNKNGRQQKNHCFIVTANAVKTYRELFENLKNQIHLDYKEIEIILDEKNINPLAESINFLADYSYSLPMKLLPIAPIYVRDFIVFSKK